MRQLTRLAFAALAVFAIPACGQSNPSTTGGSGGGGTTTTSACSADTSADPENCGACGHSCLGGACAAGACQAVQTTVDTSDPLYALPLAVAVTADNLYYVAASGFDTGKLFQVPRHGGAAKDLGFIPMLQRAWMFTQGRRVFVYTDSCCVGPNTFLWDEDAQELSESGGASGTDQLTAAWLAADRAVFGGDSILYFDKPDNSGPRGTLDALTTGPSAIAGNSHLVVLTADEGAHWALFEVEQADLALGMTVAPKVLAKPPGAPFLGLAANEEAAFGAGGTEITRVDLANGQTSQLVAADVHIELVVAGPKDVYWIDGNGPTARLMTAPAAGGAARELASVPGLASSLRLDDEGLSWATIMPSAVWQLAL